MVEWNRAERCVKVKQSGTTDERERNVSGPSYERELNGPGPLVTLTAGGTVACGIFPEKYGIYHRDVNLF